KHGEVVVNEWCDEVRVVDVVEASRRLELDRVRQVLALRSVDEGVPRGTLGLRGGQCRLRMRRAALTRGGGVLRQLQLDRKLAGTAACDKRDEQIPREVGVNGETVERDLLV